MPTMLKTKLIVAIADAKVSNNPTDVIMTYSLGSCIGVTLYDAANKIGAMAHYQLPESSLDPQRAKEYPFMYADTSMEYLLNKLESIGINKKRLQIKIAGGASMVAGPKGFDIGKRNHLAIRKIFWKHGMFIDKEDVGGSEARNMSLDIENGIVTIKTNGKTQNL
jgi:chemotaxis protein CheD